VEIFYALTDQNSKNVEELKLTEIEYLSSQGKTVSLPVDCRSLKLALRFF
jgi:hydroxymethylpyrimidine/phosphomethylpyrimidine kinase